jgi:hypothetical protein
MSNKVKIYSCGGCAMNIVSELEAAKGEVVPGFAAMETCYIDTSRSNLINKKIDDELTFILEGMDGSGKIRSTNYQEIAKNVKGILLKFKPTQFNIVVHSASGGSGSIIGSSLVSELKQRGHEVIVIMIGSTDTRIEIDNTIKSLKTYEAIAEKVGSPVVMHYVENSKQLSRQEANKHVKRAISLLMGLFSGSNEELDTRDLKHWLNYCDIAGTEPMLSSLNFVCSENELDMVGTVVSCATLAAHGMETRLDAKPAYQAVGYPPEIWKSGNKGSLQMLGEHPIHYTVSDDFITPTINQLTKTLREIDEVFGSRNARERIVSRNDNITDNGVIL